MTDGAGFEQEEEESGESVVEAATDAVRAMLSLMESVSCSP